MSDKPAYDPAWLPFLPIDVLDGLQTPLDVAKFELESWQRATGDARAVILLTDKSMGDSYLFEQENENEIFLTGGETGLLYGVYDYLQSSCAELPLPLEVQKPRYGLRILNCWDNMTGVVERGYAGGSLFFKNGDIVYDEKRIRVLGRLLASVGVNVICINNVNVVSPAEGLITERYLPKVKALAELFAAYGIRILLSVDYAMPTYFGLPTADPLDENVQAFWRKQVDLVYEAVPTLAGFMVKADSEYRPGPFTYGRDHAQGANLLARALKPHGGFVVWRCFVYNCRQDWRDHTTDRPKAAYESYAHLDGQFDDNVILQIKNGPFDFQVCEPISPLLLAMPGTKKALEVQLAQEYTGHQIDLYQMSPMWREIWEALPKENVTAVTAVGNLGDDDCWTGHPFAQSNLFTFGRMAWNPDRDPAKELALWVKLSYHMTDSAQSTLTNMLLHSREVYQKYTSRLGLGWMINPGVHYGPSPEGYEYSLWGTYMRAGRDAVGIDRTASGTDYLSQYPKAFAKRYETPESCPDELKLFFHRLRYDYVMSDGRTLIQRLYDDQFEGADGAREMSEQLDSLKGELPKDVYRIARERMDRQLKNAEEWRDVINNYFFRLSGVPDARKRKIYE